MELSSKQLIEIVHEIGHELQPEKAFSMEELTQVLGLSKPTIYEEMNSGRLRSYTVGTRRFATREAVREWQAGQEATTVIPKKKTGSDK